ncbi:MAG TPA: 4-hydroxy-tetrahydrodipicolinate reductase [Spirochaetota bacterium]|nr:4-hydroxy-tetrahydrodipicolinate reductase [Spirochaetota bacterium]HOM38151.1 4-hydroxy-tetrahydrodipicolinate reductase [Spirochaetota bacterium]HPQ48631.1 4-hydroxy-tetrahydrodipicolinate reductase [Spirochaetota bacterium]
MTKIGINGARGRMGIELCQSVIERGEACLSYICEKKDHPEIGKTFFNLVLGFNKDELLKSSDVVIDFTTPLSTMDLLEKNINYKKPIVIGTTGLNDEQNSKVKEYSNSFPIVYSPNYSIGINLLFNILEKAGEVLSKDKDYDLEVVEYHHRFKKDAPSGTALKLAEVAAKATGRKYPENMVFGREGIKEKTPDEFAVLAVRAGDIIGEHYVIFSTLGERIEFVHKAHSRKTFAKGAVEASLWVKDKKSGIYSMKDVLGL